jgi:hypothetical protein
MGLGSSAPIKGKSISEGGGCHYKPDHSGDQGSLKAARAHGASARLLESNGITPWQSEHMLRGIASRMAVFEIP